MKVLALGLNTAPTSSYSQTATTLQGRTQQRVINDGSGNRTVVGPNVVQLADVFDDTGAAPTTIHATTPNGRLFIGKGVVGATGVWTISYYTISATTGAMVWQGDLKLTMNTAAATYAIKGFAVDDSTPSAMIFQWAATHTTTTNGGLFGCWGVPTTDFAKVSVITYPAATSTGSLTKTVYQQGDASTQAATTLTVSDGVGLDTTGQVAYVLNGAAATPSIFKFSYASPPTAATGGYGNSNFSLKTGTLAALSGTVLLVNNVQVYTPTAQPAPANTNNGSLCMGWLTSTNLYFAKVSDITSGVTTLPSLITATYAGSGGLLTPTASVGQYSPTLDRWMILSSLGICFTKVALSTDPSQSFFGSNSFVKTETGQTVSPPDFGGVTNLCLTDMSGWAVMTNSAVGQRNALALDLTSDQGSTNPSTGQILSSVISQVVSGNITQGVSMGALFALGQRAIKPVVQWRTSNFSTGPGAGFDATWTTAADGDLSGIVNATQVQFRFLFPIDSVYMNNPAQIVEGYFVYSDLTQISEYWEGSVNNTTPNGNSPSYTAFRLRTAYASSVPTMYFRAYDDSGNLVASANTSANPTSFQYTTNNGTSWTALGTVPNTALTTELRYIWATPPGVQVTCSLAES